MMAFRTQAERDERWRSRCCWYLLAWFLLGWVVIVAFAWLLYDSSKEPRYYAAITSASGLDAAMDYRLGRRATPTTLELDPAFNVTLRIASRSHTGGACVDAGAALDVSYRGVRLAGAPAPRLCAGRMKAAATAPPGVVAWGAAVRVPGFALRSLAEEMARGDAAFDVTLTVPSVHDDSRQGKLVRCVARRVGDVVGALRAPCVVIDVDTAVAVPQRGA
ncbi:unnamed protein product [Urochloa humidicola]